MKISALINTINEEKNITECLKTLDWVDEIVVVDMDSDDKTKDLSYKFTKNVFNHKRMGYVEPARNFGIKQTTGDWILILDADERIPNQLAAKLYQIAVEDKVNFVRIPRKNLVFGQWLQHSRWWPDHNVRFFKKGNVHWQNAIHSIPITYGEGLTLPAEENLAIVHYHYHTLSEFLERMFRYTKIQSQEIIKSGYKFKVSDIIEKPIAEFLSRFFFGQGYKDGLHGLALSSLQAFSELVLYLRIWEEQGFPKHSGAKFEAQVETSFAAKAKEFKYWLLTLKLTQTKKPLDKLLLKIRRRTL